MYVTPQESPYVKPATGIPASDLAADVIPEVPVQDVKVNGTSILSNGIANIPEATESQHGVVKIGAEGTTGVRLTNGVLNISEANEVAIRNGTNNKQPITPYYEKQAAYYGLAKAAGATDIGNTVGQYTDSAKSAIRNMIGAANADDIVAVQDTQPTSDDNKIWLPETAPAGVEVPTVAEMNTALAEKVDDVQVNGQSIVQNGVANVPIASNTAPGAVRIAPGYGLQVNSSNGLVNIVSATNTYIKVGTEAYMPITPIRQHSATFYGLTKAAGVDMASSSNTVGTYTSEAKGAIQSMLGVSDLIAPDENDLIADRDYAVGDIFTANGKVYKATAEILTGATIVTTGNNVNCEETSVANTFVKKTQYAGSGGKNTAGLVWDYNGAWGIKIQTASGYEGALAINPAPTNVVKDGVNGSYPITAVHQHESTFYGLAKASGDTTQSASSNAVGVYTDNAKASIKAMLGIQDGSTGTVDVSGTAPVITAVENTRYVCGEVTTLTITPPSSGICIVRFTSGTTPTVLTANNVIWPDWFDSTELEASRVYEICITDGYGAVMSWAL